MSPSAMVENSKEVSQEIKNKLPCDLAVPFLGIYLNKRKTLI